MPYQTPTGNTGRRTNCRVAVALSGGVDSAAAALAMRDAGHDIIGLTLKLGHAEDDTAIVNAGRICTVLRIPHHVVAAQQVFQQAVIEPFVAGYLNATTPNPCVLCNQAVKSGLLAEAARQVGACAMATGHYARLLPGPDNHQQLWRGSDSRRDQSYFLFALTQAQLDFARFPLGETDKDAVRARVAAAGLPIAHRPDSQDICFIPDGDYAGFLQRCGAGINRPGDIVSVGGVPLGQHRGLAHYTIGQRRGLNIGGQADPLYVIAMNPIRNQLIAGPKSALFRQDFRIERLNWLSGSVPDPTQTVMVRVRSSMRPVTACLQPESNGRALVRLAEPFGGGIAPGQACVAEDGGHILGGGWICPDETD